MADVFISSKSEPDPPPHEAPVARLGTAGALAAAAIAFVLAGCGGPTQSDANSTTPSSAAMPSPAPAPAVAAPAAPAGPASYSAGQKIKDCADCPELVAIPGGTFTMGSPSSEANRGSDEGPQRSVSIGAFAVGKFEVTWDEWTACVSAGYCSTAEQDKTSGGGDNGWGRGNRPVMRVSWDDAKTYVAWLSRKTGNTYRLLTEAEWEYAARAGKKTAYYTGASISTSQANFNNTLRKTEGVGSYSPNAFGLYDMHGNVWEWVEDCHHESYAGAPSDGSAWTAGACSSRVLRGGSWGDNPQYLRLADRSAGAPSGRYSSLGFRVARTL